MPLRLGCPAHRAPRLLERVHLLQLRQLSLYLRLALLACLPNRPRLAHMRDGLHRRQAVLNSLRHWRGLAQPSTAMLERGSELALVSEARR
eukprot:scaffold2564_cov65-Phaeocystis_antarctica.AAC.6